MPVPKIIENRWDVYERLGEGNFGVVHRASGRDMQEHVAIKFEENNRRRAPNQLHEEVKRMQHLQSDAVVPQGVMKVFFCGSDALTMYNFAVVELLGKSLEDYLSMKDGKFSVATTALIAEQCLQRCEFLHSKGIVHRDIKPENFMLGIGKKLHHIYLVDFGLSETYYDDQHCPMLTDVSLVGNARYSSLNAHAGVQQSRRDDLEALGYMLFQFLLGKLPWTGLQARSIQEKYRKIHDKKATVSINDLCKGFPEQFGTYLLQCRKLTFFERPDYRYLQGLFTDVRKQINGQTTTTMLDHDFDWLLGDQRPHDLEPLRRYDFVQPDDSKNHSSAHCPKHGSTSDDTSEATPPHRFCTLRLPEFVPPLDLNEDYSNESDVSTPKVRIGNGPYEAVSECMPET